MDYNKYYKQMLIVTILHWPSLWRKTNEKLFDFRHKRSNRGSDARKHEKRRGSKAVLGKGRSKDDFL